MTHRTLLTAATATAVLLAAPTGTLASGSARTVSVKDDKFVAKSVTIKRGGKVKWVWKGKAPHNVTSVSGPASFRSSTKTSGTYTRKFTKRGTYKLLCTIHAPDMVMTVKVK